MDARRAGLLERFASFPASVAAASRAGVGRVVPPGEWGPAEVIRHLIAVESEVFASRLAQIAVDADAHWDWTEPGLAAGFDDAPLDAILEAFAAARAATVATVQVLDDGGWTRAGTHATYGRLDVAGLLRLAIDHDAEHLAGIGGA